MASCTPALQQVKEGQTKAFLPPSVFYNPVQEFNRDMTIAVIQEYADLHKEEWMAKMEKRKAAVTSNPETASYYEYGGLRILEALAASGLRSARFAVEVGTPRVAMVMANDIDPEACRLIDVNAQLNGVENILQSSCEDAVVLMMKHRKMEALFNVIDIDPYGTASPFLDGAVQSVFEGGLLCVTCTDTAVLCGSTEGTSYGKYGSVAVKCTAVHEQGLRILLHAIQAAASRHSKVIEPLLSLSIDFYVRVFVRVRSSPSKVKEIASKLANLYVCTGCQTYHMQPLATVHVQPNGHRKISPARGPPVGSHCEHCGSVIVMGGPLWADPIHSETFLQRLLARLKSVPKDESGKSVFGTLDRMIGMISLLKEELPDCPLHYKSDQLARTVHTVTPSLVDIRSAILNAGHRVSLSHTAVNSLKTSAPPRLLWDIMRCWVRDRHPVREDHISSSSIVRTILTTPVQTEANFESHPLANPPSRLEKLLRYQPNPEPEWGPKARPCRKEGDNGDSSLLEKRLRLQGKRKIPDEDDIVV